MTSTFAVRGHRYSFCKDYHRIPCARRDAACCMLGRMFAVAVNDDVVGGSTYMYAEPC